MAIYHVVCHDCPYGARLITEMAAESACLRHGKRNGHDVEYARVD